MNGARADIPEPQRTAARAFVLLLAAALYFVKLGAGSLWDNSEPTYGEIVKELFRTGNWLTLHFNFAPWYIHPPLWFWTAGLFSALFGLNEFALRFPSALFGLLEVAAVYAAGRKLYGEAAGLIAALALGSSLEFIVLARLAILDTMLVFFATIATFWCFFAIRDGDRRAFWIAVVAAALGTMTKGPVAVVLPILVLYVWCSSTSSWSRLGALPWAAGTAVFLALAGAWFAATTIVAGPQFLQEYFGASTVGRFVVPFENQPGPFWYYLPVLVLGFFPYVAFLPKAIKEAWRAGGSEERFLLAFAIVPLIFFSIAQTKLPNYIAIVFPALAVLVGAVLGGAVLENRLRPLRGALIMLPVSLVLLTMGLVWYGRGHYLGQFLALVPSLELLGWIVVPAAIGTALATLLFKRAWLAPAGLSLMMAGFVFALAFAILPRVEAFKPMKSMAAVVMSYWRPGDRIGITGVSGGFSLLFYTEARGITFVGALKGNTSPDAFFDKRYRALCLITPREFRDLLARGIRLWALKRTPTMWLVTNQPPRAAARKPS